VKSEFVCFVFMGFVLGALAAQDLGVQFSSSDSSDSLLVDNRRSVCCWAMATEPFSQR